MSDDLNYTGEGESLSESLSNEQHAAGELASPTCEETQNNSESYSQLLSKDSGLSGKPVIDGMKFIDQLSYSINEVPQVNLLDPDQLLPLNSDNLVVDELELQVDKLAKEEEIQIEKELNHIDSWNKRIEKNKLHIEKNNELISDNKKAILYDKKNRDYWVNRAEAVTLDFENASSANRQEDWSWVIKKYGLKYSDGSSIEANDASVEELVNGGTANLIGQYRTSANYYEQIRKDKERDNNRTISEISKLKNSNETLKSYIDSAYVKKVQPLQNGVLLLNGLREKLEEFKKQGNSTYSEIRDWSEEYLNDFIKQNPDVPQSVVTDFRKIASIPLPAENS